VKRVLVYVIVGVLSAVLTTGAAASSNDPFHAGAPGIGDPYFPLDGNGGYDVGHYTLDIRYDPAAHHIDGTATIEATATENLSSFNLDLQGLDVHSVSVDWWNATWTRDGSELTVTPKRGLHRGHDFTVVVHYDGVPEMVDEPPSPSGVFQTDDGMLIMGQPHVAATWFPVNDHPLDKASYTIKVTVPAGLEVVSNGVLKRKKTKHRLTTFVWQASDPMASYLATAAVGKFDITSYREDGIRFYDAIDPALLEPIAKPTTGTQLAISGQADASYKRLARTLAVPAGGATLSFWITRDTEPGWDFVFVEAHTVGADDWTTLPDANGHTSDDTGISCLAGWQGIHPFLAHYQTNTGPDTCIPTGTTGSWSAASGLTDGTAEQWQVDLAAYAGKSVELSITYASDDVFQAHGVFIDDITSSTGEGSTSFEADGDTFDGWTVPGAPAGSPGNENDWIAGTTADEPDNFGQVAKASFAREPEILRFLSSQFGPYPFRDAGGIVDHLPGVGFALENQTRPIYAQEFFYDPIGADSVVVHELAHQWYGDSVAVGRWQDIWLNEGFATYAEWLWGEHEGLDVSPQGAWEFFGGLPADDPFWTLTIGDPGPEALFDGPVYARGGLTLQALRMAVGDDAFFRILRKWAASKAGGNGTTPEFIALAERISGQDLDALFTTWLFTPVKPDFGPAAPAASVAAMSTFAFQRTAAVTYSHTRALRR
jgi:hypothetical protein